MKKLSEYKDGEALDMMADMLDPLVSLTKNETFMRMINDKNASRLEIVQVVLRECKQEMMQILATLNGVPVEEYHCSIASIIKDMSAIFADKDFTDFFESQGQKSSDTTFGSVTENTGDAEK